MDPESVPLRTGVDALQLKVPDTSVWKGIVVLFLSWFTMPFKTLKVAAQQLRELGSAGVLEIGDESPHLNWVRVAGGTLAASGTILSLVVGVGKAILGLGDLQYSPGLAIGGLILFPLLGLLGAVLVDWFIMMGVEVLGIQLGISKDVHRIVSKP